MSVGMPRTLNNERRYAQDAEASFSIFSCLKEALSRWDMRKQATTNEEIT
jgi:hypothetical protein